MPKDKARGDQVVTGAPRRKRSKVDLPGSHPSIPAVVLVAPGRLWLMQRLTYWPALIRDSMVPPRKVRHGR